MAELKRFVEFLKANDFFADEEDIQIALKEKTHATIEDKTSMIRLDIKGIYSENDRLTIKRRRRVNLADFWFYIASPEDTIANKLLFGSDQDMRDAEGIYVRQLDNLEMAYLEERCKKLEVYDDFLRMKERVKRSMPKKG